MKRAQPERQLQAAVAQYLKAALPADAFFSALPGGDGRMTRAPGYRSGLPDMMVLYKGQAIFFELKSKTGRVTQRQRDAADHITTAGGIAWAVNSLIAVDGILRGSGVPLRARIAA